MLYKKFNKNINKKKEKKENRFFSREPYKFIKSLATFNILILILFTLILCFNVYASGSIITGQITPSNVNLCGNNAQYVTINAYNLLNIQNDTLLNVNAILYLEPSNSGLSFITNQQVNLGNINPLSYSSINPSWTLQCNSPNSGIYKAYINYTSSNNYKASSYNEQYSTIIVHDVISFTGNISLESTEQTIEEDYPLIKDNTPTIKVTTTKNSICKGSLNLDKDFENMDFLFYGLEKEHNYTFINQLQDSKYILFVKCKDEINNIMQLTMQFEIDSKEPIITIIEPKQKVLGTFTEISITTNENAECRYSKSNINFDEMKSFNTFNTTIFKTKLDDLEEQTYTYYVKCKDKIGNLAEKTITFDVAILPKASIVLEKNTLTKGTYELKLYPTKKLKSAYLSYFFTDEPQIVREIGLVRESNYFKGYLIIDEHEKTRQGIFSFKGIDLQDNEGTEITDGSFFIVDTIKPKEPESVQAINTEEGVLLKWYYDGEKPEKFNIYRSTTQGVSPIFYYDSIMPNDFENYYEYLDKNVESGKLYYYKIAAVDLANNIGTLSNEVNAYVTLQKSEIIEQQIIEYPTQQTREQKKQTEKNIDTLLIDLEWALNNLKEQATKEKLVEELSLIKKVLDSKQSIEQQKSYLKNINLNEISDTELRTKISEIDALIARTKKLTPKNIEIIKTTSQLQAITDNDIELIVKEIFSNQNYSESKINKYLKEVKKINKDLKVETEIKTIKIIFIDDTFENQIVVKKTFNYEKPEPLKDILIIEVIPKTVAGDISSIDVKTPDYSIVNPDPIISWKFDEISYDKKSYYYILLSNDNSESAKTTKTIALIDPIKILNNDETILTGFSIFISEVKQKPEYLGLFIGSLIIVVLLVYYLFSIDSLNLKYYLTNFETKIKNTKNLFKIFKQKEEHQNSLLYTNGHSDKKNQNYIFDQNINEQLSKEKIYKNGFNEENRFKEDNLLKIYSIKNLILNENLTQRDPKDYFYAKNGEIIRGISELKEAIEKMDDFTFYYHLNESKNDFANWIDTLYQNKTLTKYMKEIKSKEEMIDFLNNFEV